ncbi:hypothetical protein [Methyloceanibacter caenitepidi]|uniref:Uncharacterized protein n=1 Tax=Methyloceanibacter caenitepidi TaxID=1384459 RepID=A0A0A8K789_9HYPH|nr:hypothetical protein [Methyloceanibacter caenitepidi]BAQ18357.1 hypothetical protein GL4_2924 [Methyloceanibacter caenitepidi]
MTGKTSPELIRDLIEKVEAGSGPDRDIELDVAIWALFEPSDHGCAQREYETKLAQAEANGLTNRKDACWRFAFGRCPKYSASIDAAVALTEKLFPGINWDVSWIGGEWRPGYIARARVAMPYSGRGDKEDGFPCEKGEAKTAPRALLSATLRAKLAMMEDS